MNSRERVRAAITFQRPDRVPLDLGSTDVTGIHRSAYQRLCETMGVVETTSVIDSLQGLARVSRVVLGRLGVDTVGVWLNPTLRAVGDGRVQDEWGTLWAMPEHGLWYEPVKFPLQTASLAQVMNYTWPDPGDPAKLAGVAEQARALYEETGLALVANFSGALLARGQLLRGPAEFLTDLLTNPELTEEIMERVLAYNLELVDRFLEQVGPNIEVIKISDDLGAQDNLLISPSLYRQLIKPRQQRFIKAIHEKTSARILYHTCGSVHKLIDDFIEIGVDILNPLQVSARGMDTQELGRKYAGRLVFWGAVDNQGVISQGDPQAVEAEVRRRIADLSTPAGGYVVAASHNIQPDTAVENILKLCQTDIRRCKESE